MTAPRARMRIQGPRATAAYVRHLGAPHAAARAGYVLANQAIRLSVFDCLSMGPGEAERGLLSHGKPYECRFLEPDEAAGLAAGLGAEPAATAREAADRGDVCFGVLDSGRLANMAWFSPRPTPLVGDLVVRFEPPAWYMYGAWTPPEYRGRRLHAVGLIGGALSLFDQGVPELVTVYERTNYRTIVSTMRMGWTRRGRLHRIGAGPWDRTGRDAGAAQAGMSLELRDRAEESS